MYVIQRSKTGHYVRTVHTPQAGECALKPVDLNEVPGADEEGAPQARDVRVTIDVTLLGGPTLETDITVREGKNNAETRSHALLALQEEMDEARRNAPSSGQSPRLRIGADGHVRGWVLIEEIAAVWAGDVCTSDGRSIEDE